jgi:RHS repeat-associated protein
VTPPEGAAYELDYNERGELITITRDSFSEKRSHDVNGHIIRQETSVSSSTSLIETASYLQNGFMTSISWLGVETDGGTQPITTTFTPDSSFRVKEIDYPGPQVRRYMDFDHLGRPHKMQIDDYSEDYAFDLNGNLLTVTRAGATDEFIYDGYDRLIGTKVASSSAPEESTREYFGNGELRKVTIKDGNGIVNLEHTYDIDSSGRIRTLTIAADAGPATTTYAYDQASRTASITSPAQETVTLSYNSSGQTTTRNDSQRTVTLNYQNGTEVKTVTSQEGSRTFLRDFQPYNPLNQSQRVSDGLGTIADLLPRTDGRIEQVTDGLGHKMTLGYSKLGEVLSRVRDNQVEFQHRYADHRAQSHAGDKTGAGHTHTFDNAFRLKTRTLRNPASIFTTTSFDLRNNAPLTVTIPGGVATYGRDAKGRMTSRSISFGSETRSETWGYDGLDRVVAATFPQGEATMGYDKLGPLVSSITKIQGTSYEVGATIRNDGARLSLTYPAGDNSPQVTVTEGRDSPGRLTTLSPSSGLPILSQSTYGGADFMSQETLGPSLIQCANTYDDRKRLTARAYKLAGSGVTLAEVRYAYDLADNLTARQYLHRSGRTDLFGYDNGNRLTRAEIGVRPVIADAATRVFPGFAVPPNVPGSWAAGYFSRGYGYSADALDTFTGMTETNPDGVPASVVANTYSGTDGFLNIQSFDGAGRSSDELGNSVLTRLVVRKPGVDLPVALDATLTYNGLSQLTRIVRADGVVIRYEYQHDGLLCYRTVEDPTLPGGKAESAFVWHDGLLLAEFDRTTGNQLKARYYYGLGDVPLAADLAAGGGVPQRFYLLQEANGSTMALVDGNGQVAERYFYDPWGQPEIQAPDQTAPRIRRIVSDGDGLLLEFSERVLPPLLNPGPSGLVNQTAGLANALTLTNNGQVVVGALQLVEQLTNFAFGTVLRFRPLQPISGSCTLSFRAGALVDEANNANISQDFAFNFDSTPGTALLALPDQASTGPEIRMRSAVGCSLLFHGQLFDYDAGLCYMRARFYDPFAGLFLQPDPDSYEDSPNLYASFGNNPTSYRDPSGTLRISAARIAFGRFLVRTGKALSRASPRALRPISKFISRTGRFVETGMRAGARLDAAQYVRQVRQADAMRLLEEQRLAARISAQNLRRIEEANMADDLSCLKAGGREALETQFGETQRPWLVRPGEGTAPPDMQIVRPGERIHLEPYTTPQGKPGNYLYVVDAQGNLRVAREYSAGGRVVKHTDLTAIGEGRVGGEIVPTETPGIWGVNSNSGRYSLRPAPGAEGWDPQMLQRVPGALIQNRSSGNVRAIDRFWRASGGQTIISLE